MKSEKFAGVIDSYQGKKLDTPINYDGAVDQFESKAEAEAATKWPGDSEILDMLNTKVFNAAKAKVYQEKTKSLKEAYEASPEFKKNQFIKAALGVGMSQAQAEALAASNLG